MVQARGSEHWCDRNDPLALLEVDITYPGWEYQVGDRKSFYVRGLTWFRDRVLSGKRNVTDCGSYIPQMKELLRGCERWRKLPFPWDEPFSVRQFIDAASLTRRTTPKFQKAAEIILLCETIARDIHDRDSTRPSPNDIYDHMRIEPALSYIHGLEREPLQALRVQEKDLLRRWTGQGSNEVFYDMADGFTVTHKLAQRTRRFFTLRAAHMELGDVDYRLSHHWNRGPSRFENVAVDPAAYPDESHLGRGTL